MVVVLAELLSRVTSAISVRIRGEEFSITKELPQTYSGGDIVGSLVCTSGPPPPTSRPAASWSWSSVFTTRPSRLLVSWCSSWWHHEETAPRCTIRLIVYPSVKGTSLLNSFSMSNTWKRSKQTSKLSSNFLSECPVDFVSNLETEFLKWRLAGSDV